MTAVPPPTDLAAWLTELEAAHEEFRRGGPGAAAVTLFTFPEAIPRLVAAVRAVEALADRWEQFAATRLTGIDARHMRAAAADVRRYVTEALTPERTTP